MCNKGTIDPSRQLIEVMYVTSVFYAIRTVKIPNHNNDNYLGFTKLGIY